MKLPAKTLEQRLLRSGYKYVIGIDEVGMGCLAGPVFVSAVLVDKKFFNKRHKKLRWLRDSKLLLSKQREEFFKAIENEGEINYATVSCKPETIDKLNIYRAARFAMKRAIKKLVASSKYKVLSKNLNTIVLVDGKTKIEGIELDQMPIVKGDRKIFTIACASIIAKVHRDRAMVRYARKFPDYGFEQHKGYGTKYHQEKLKLLGPCKLHRRSFGPVAKLI